MPWQLEAEKLKLVHERRRRALQILLIRKFRSIEQPDLARVPKDVVLLIARMVWNDWPKELKRNPQLIAAVEEAEEMHKNAVKMYEREKLFHAMRAHKQQFMMQKNQTNEAK